MSVKGSAANPYRQFVEAHTDLLKHGAMLPLGGLTPSKPSPTSSGARHVLIFSPHPDDECIIGGLPLRLLREGGMQVTNVAVTLGRHPERQQTRWRELESACAYIGFGLLRTCDDGLSNVDLAARERQPRAWSASVAAIAEILDTISPDIVFMPHDGDWHPAHIGTHHLVLDALATLPTAFTCHVIETEFWAAMAMPTLMVESGPDDVADLAAALSFHVGEVSRNPYHLRLPAWMIDNVRRGSELVQGKGAAAPEMTFATLYGLRKWVNHELQHALPRGRVLSATDDVTSLFA